MLKRLLDFVTPHASPTKGETAEQRTALLAGQHIPYTLKRSRKRRSIGLRIDDRGLTVSMPLRASERWLHEVLQDKARWVVEKLDGWQRHKPVEMRWSNGETIPLLGEPLTLRVRQSLFAAPVQRQGSQLLLFVVDDRDAAHIEQLVLHWYRGEAERWFTQRVGHYAASMGVTPRAVKLSSAKTQWGCCTAGGTVRLNWQLIKLPPALIDYVVVHELAHLREMNHSASFWKLVENTCPDYAKLRRDLKAVAL